MLPSSLQVIVVKPVSMTLLLGLFTLALFGTVKATKDLTTKWETPPAMKTFSSYEDMQRYFDYRNYRNFKNLENPLEDSYIEAFNKHNEQKIQRSKRSANQQQLELKQQPILIKFEVADAVEPSDEVKELIRQYKSRELQQNEKYMETVPPSNNKKSKSYNKLSGRAKRSTKYQQPANFKVQYIPFDESDAREPDAHTKVLIKRMRELEIEKHIKQLPLSHPSSHVSEALGDSTSSTTTKEFPYKRSKYSKQRKLKRLRRETPAAPEMIKFEISDAKDPDLSSKTFKKTKQTREAKDLKVEGKPATEEQAADTSETANSDQNSEDTKRYFVFKEASPKVKKSVTAIPHDVQNIISHLIKSGSGSGYGGRAYVKHIPAQQMDYNNLKVAYPIVKGSDLAGYGHGGGSGIVYGKYAHTVPVKFVYHPVVVGAIGGHGDGGGGHEGVGEDAAGRAAPVKYVAIGGGGGEGNYGGGENGGYGGSYNDGYGGGEGGGGYGGAAIKYVTSADGGEGGNGGGGGAYEPVPVAIKYVAPVGIETGGYEGRNENGAGGEGNSAEGGHGGGYAAGRESGSYAATGGHGNNYAFVHGGGLSAHASYAGNEGGGHSGGYSVGYVAAPAAIVHPIVMANAEGGQPKAMAYATSLGEAGITKNFGNNFIKNIPAPQFKGEIKYSVVPTVEQYAKTPTQDFQLKLYSPESLIAKAQLEAKDKAKAIAEEGQKAVAAAYKLAAEKTAGGYAGGEYGGKSGEEGGGSKDAEGYGGIGEGGYGGGKGAGGYAGAEASYNYDFGEGGYAGGKADGGREYGGKVEGGVGGNGKGTAGYVVGGGGYGREKGTGGYNEGVAGSVGGKGGAGYDYNFGEGGYAGGKNNGGDVGPLIKIEYHAPANAFKGNYKDMPEFKQLSSLVGKSPEDQIHGLTYLLAKEMQNRLHLQRQQNYGAGGGVGGVGKTAGKGGSKARPQDNKAPVLFHSGEAANLGAGGGAGGEGEGSKVLNDGASGAYYQPIVGKYIGMAKSNQYIPVIEQAALEELNAGKAGVGGGDVKSGAATGGNEGDGKNSYLSYGLSSNYKGLAGLKPTTIADGAGEAGNKALNDNGYAAAAAKLQSYASKYAFGYRIRDFSTGNDFGHKQNRDSNGVTRGQYHILLPDGRIQNVIYHADDTGFHADVSFESGR